MHSLILLLVLALLTPAHASANAVSIGDGDSFRLGEHRYRLYGMDAPELHQDCKDAEGESWPCGVRARTELRRIIATDPLECRSIETDRYGRIVATCLAGHRDVAEEMVRSGFAVAAGRPGKPSPYEEAQRQARAAKRGLWAGTFDMPREWRRGNPRHENEERAVMTPREWLDEKLAALRQLLSQWFPSLFGS